jgi:hypothetical protein
VLEIVLTFEVILEALVEESLSTDAVEFKDCG